jgi:AcrR family transcriptional regulator
MSNTDPAKQRETQRANILEGAKRVFARKGHAATMADVAVAAGVSQGLAYRYFASKEEIYRALVDQALEHADLMAAQPLHEYSATPGERLTRLITRLVEYRRDHLEFFQLLDQVLNSSGTPDDIVELIRQRREHFLGEFRQLIIDGQASGEVAAGDPDQLVIAMTACLDGLTRFGLHHPEQFHRLCPAPSILLRMLKP